MILSRRNFLRGLGAALAAPAVIRIPGILMPIRAIERPLIVSAYFTSESAWFLKSPYPQMLDMMNQIYGSAGL